MAIVTRRLGHPTLRREQLSPVGQGSFSPNLYRWMRAKAHFYKGGGVLQSVYRVLPDTKLAQDFGAGTAMIGYPDDSDEDGFIGVRLMSALCEGARAGSYYYSGIAAMLVQDEGFWDRYLQVGRCAIDPGHQVHFQGNRYSFAAEAGTRTCLWCGTQHQRVLTPQTILHETWTSLSTD